MTSAQGQLAFGASEHLPTLRRVLDASARGIGQVLVVDGGFGTGKTRLLEDTQRLARDRFVPVLRARASRAERELRFGLIRQLLHGLSLDPPRTARATRTNDVATVESVAWRLADVAASSENGLLVMVDDAEHADDLSLNVLAALALRTSRMGVTILVAARRQPARLGIARLRAAGTVLSLGPLPPARIAAIVRSRVPEATADYIRQVSDRTGGLPLLVGTLLAEPPSPDRLALHVPDEVHHRLRAVLFEAGQVAAQVAEVVSVLGDAASLPDVMTLTRLDSGTAGAAVDRLVAEDVFAAGPPLRFAQPMLATAAHEAISEYARSALHRQAAQLLAGRSADPDAVADHLLQTNPADDAWVAEQLGNAADRARERDDPARVVRYLARAVAEPPSPERLASMLLSLAAAKITLGDASAGVHLQQVLQLRDAGSAATRAKKLLAQLAHMQGHAATGLTLLDEALAGADVTDPRHGPLVSGYLTMTVVNLDLHDRGEAVARPLLDAVRRGALPADPGVAAHVALRLALRGDPAVLVCQVAERAFRVDPLIDSETQGGLLGFVVRSLIATDQLSYADEACTKALESAQARRMVFGVSYALYHRGLVRLHLGRLDEALADVTGAAGPAPDGMDRGGPLARRAARPHPARPRGPDRGNGRASPDGRRAGDLPRVCLRPARASPARTCGRPSGRCLAVVDPGAGVPGRLHPGRPVAAALAPCRRESGAGTAAPGGG